MFGDVRRGREMKGEVERVGLRWEVKYHLSHSYLSQLHSPVEGLVILNPFNLEHFL